MQKKVTEKLYYYNINNDHSNEKMQEIKMDTICFQQATKR